MSYALVHVYLRWLLIFRHKRMRDVTGPVHQREVHQHAGVVQVQLQQGIQNRSHRNALQR